MVGGTPSERKQAPQPVGASVNANRRLSQLGPHQVSVNEARSVSGQLRRRLCTKLHARVQSVRACARILVCVCARAGARARGSHTIGAQKAYPDEWLLARSQLWGAKGASGSGGEGVLASGVKR